MHIYRVGPDGASTTDEATFSQHYAGLPATLGTLSGALNTHVPAIARDAAHQAVAEALAEREARENIRANHRNLNRMLTLIGALLIGIVVSYVLSNKGAGIVPPALAHTLAPYAFVITIIMDSGLALYGLIRHY